MTQDIFIALMSLVTIINIAIIAAMICNYFDDNAAVKQYKERRIQKVRKNDLIVDITEYNDDEEGEEK